MNIMDYPSERICEALGWLYGGEWKHNMEAGEKSAFTNEFNDRVGLDIEDGLCMWRGWFKRNIEDDLTHALEVTEPWEWIGLYFSASLLRHNAFFDEEDAHILAAVVSKHRLGERVIWKWRVASDEMPNMDMHADDEESAKTAARAAYLRWMRGGLER